MSQTDQPTLNLHLPWTLHPCRGGSELMLLDSRGHYCGGVQVYQTPRVMGEYDEERRRACAALILRAVNYLTPPQPFPWPEDELYNADPECKHEIVDAPGGGVKCRKCPAWFCA